MRIFINTIVPNKYRKLTDPNVARMTTRLKLIVGWLLSSSRITNYVKVFPNFLAKIAG